MRLAPALAAVFRPDAQQEAVLRPGAQRIRPALQEEAVDRLDAAHPVPNQRPRVVA